MTFTVRDLMIDVLPATFAEADELRLCANEITLTPPQPKPPKPPHPPKPGPKPPKPGCVGDTMPGAVQGAGEWTAELLPLEALREQLQRALHA